MRRPTTHRVERGFRLGLLLGAFVLASGLASCGDDTAGDDGPTTVGGVDLDSVIYEGGATDEALTAILSAEAEINEEQAVTLDTPESPISSEQPVAFTWHVGAATGRFEAPGKRDAARALVGQTRRASALDFFSISTAHAHGAPVNGRAYLLTFRDADDKALAYVFTTALSFTPSADVWSTLRDAPQPVELEILNAVFDTNRIPSDGGPFLGSPASLNFE